jgi:hypothetical protein
MNSQSTTEPAFYRLAEVEDLFRISRDTLLCWARAGIFDLQGENRGRRATGASVRAAYRRIDEGENLWEVAKRRTFDSALPAPVRRKRRATPEVSSRDAVQVESPLVKKGPAWLKKIG